jgi:hypothetical protein
LNVYDWLFSVLLKSDVITGVLRLGETAIHLGEKKYTFGRRKNIGLGEEKFIHLGERKIVPGNISY